jgi:hypothetical protein
MKPLKKPIVFRAAQIEFSVVAFQRGTKVTQTEDIRQ